MSNDLDPEARPARSPGLITRFIRWLFCWRSASRLLFVAACLATLVGLFYVVENWRGKRAWDQCRHELEAQGAVIDWKALIPPPVPDDQNIFKAPMMTEWFVKKSWTETSKVAPAKPGNTNAPFTLPARDRSYDSSVWVANVDVVPSAGPLPPEKAGAVLRLDDPAARAQAAALLQQSLAPCTHGILGDMLIAQSRDQIKPVHLVVQSDTTVTAKELYNFLPRSPLATNIRNSSEAADIEVTPAGSNAFRVSLKAPVLSAAEFLSLSQAVVPDLDVVRKALERPCARMDDSYERPFDRPIPNFVRIRTVAQLLSQRAQCYLLLGQSADAWHELSLVRDLCHMLDAKPASDCPTLVEAMIGVAIAGLYTEIIADGLRLQAWKEPELAALQQQLATLNLLPQVRGAFNAERAASCNLFEVNSRANLKKIFSFGRGNEDFLDRLKDPAYLFVSFAPRGWFYQNMRADALMERLVLSSFDLPGQQILPRKADAIARELEAICSHFRPYTFLVALAVPNFVRAEQTTARNQTLVNAAYLACGLERYRLAHGQYPDTLEALVPRFAVKLPADVVGGQPLKYRRTEGGHFLLYSVGWNGRDDGGVMGKANSDGDWVWP
jgi:hypothetical protein